MSTESAIMREIHAAIGGRPDVRLWRRNVGVATPLGSRRAIRFGLPGQADLEGIVGPEGWHLEIEVKSPTGRLSEEQRRWGEMTIALGGIWICARSVKEAVEALDAEIARRRQG